MSSKGYIAGYLTFKFPRDFAAGSSFKLKLLLEWYLMRIVSASLNRGNMLKSGWKKSANLSTLSALLGLPSLLLRPILINKGSKPFTNLRCFLRTVYLKKSVSSHISLSTYTPSC